jgi:FlaA1/EpsC-like NDP-sugar epimerase
MKSALVTGGSGSFGRAFIRRLLADPSIERIAILSRGEHAQADMQREMDEPRLRFFIGDVRDAKRLRRAFEGIEVVVHAAALKRIEVGNYNPDEMVKTNVIGAMNVIEAAAEAGVRKIVALSTDKAYQPVSPYGQSKAIAETIFRNASTGTKGPISAVTRYGNVWGSKGSIVPTWNEILKTTDTVPVTDPECTRFYMTMDQAIDLVVDTINTMKGGELMIPTLPAYRIGDLAKAMGAKMNVIGLPPWEKKHESMCDGNCSKTARRMSVDELKGILNADCLHRPGANGEQEAPRQGAVAAQRAHSHRRGDYEVQADSWR